MLLPVNQLKLDVYTSLFHWLYRSGGATHMKETPQDARNQIYFIKTVQ